MKRIFSKYYWIIISALIVIVDQVSKAAIVAALDLYDEVTIIPGFFTITHIHNEGVAFGFLSDNGTIGKIFVAVFTTILIIFAVVVLCRGVIRQPFGVITISMIIGGGIGNLIDRVMLHYVIDFFAFTFFGKDFAVFNVADIFVTVGTFLFVIYFIFLERNTEDKQKTSNGNQEVSNN